MASKIKIVKPEKQTTSQNPSLIHYRALLRSLYDAVIVVDERGNILDCNKRAMKFFKRDEEEILNCTIMQLVGGFSVEVIDSVMRDLYAGRFTVIHGYCFRSDNSNFPAEIAIGRITTEDRDDLVFSIRNITARKAIEEELRTEHHALQNAVSSIAITGIDGVISYANPAFARLTGVQAQKATGMHISEFWMDSNDSREMMEPPTKGESWSGELQGRPELRTPPVRAHAMAAINKNADGHPIGMVFSFVDVTRLRKAEKTLQEEAKAQMESAKTSDAFSGRLSLLSITDVMQLINAAAKTGTLFIEDENGVTGSAISFNSGKIEYADCGDEQGDDAVIAALVTSGHAFRFEPGTIKASGKKVNKPTMTLLMEAAQGMDEAF